MSVLVCVPVYGGYDITQRCLAALARAPVQAPHRVLIINDSGPDERMVPMLTEYALTHSGTQLRLNRHNRGFTWNVNQAIRATRQGEHLLLLNADTVVTSGWLDQMLITANSDSKIGTVTPFSNNATICSFPDFQNTWPVPEAAERERIARALAAAPTAAIDLPTGVGFCMLITRACMDAVGLFDVEHFPRGYGEENDFCSRAAKAGFRNVLCPNAYVSHEGGVSFSDSTQALMAAGAAQLRAKHPEYDQAVAEWIAADPARERREAMRAVLGL